jgi:hypothetical protein
MSAIVLSSGAEACIEIMELLPPGSEKEQIIRECISRYTLSCDLCAALAWLVFRIENIICSFFGPTAWDQAIQILENEIKDSASKVGLYQEYTPTSEDQDIQKDVLKIFHSYAEKMLSKCYEAHWYGIEYTPRYNAEIQRLSEGAIFEKMRTTCLTEIVSEL